MARNGGDKRGSSYARKRSKEWLLYMYKERCVHCGIKVTMETMERDRINPGGPYTHANIQLSCTSCNRERGDNPDWVSPLQRGVVIV